MDREEAHQLVDKLFDLQTPDEKEDAVKAEDRKLPEGKRLVSTKGQGDRRYELDEVAKTRRWLSNPEVLEARGWKMDDAIEITDEELANYRMGPAIFRADESA